MKIIIVENKEQVSEEAFKVMKPYLKPGMVLGLATGSSPLGLYSLMIKDHQENKTDYKEITTFNLDEYVGLPITHRESYYRFMHDNLFNGIEIPEENVHVPKGLGDIEKGCMEYDQMIDEHPIDIQVLGIGSDGHIAFSEPGTPFDQGTHVAKLAPSTIEDNQRFFNDLNETTPTMAVTQGPKTIMKAKNIVLVANGKNKAQAIKDMVEGPIDPKCPASILQNHNSVIVIVDKEAASLLK